MLKALSVVLAILVLAYAAGFAAATIFDAWANVDQPRAYYAGEAEALTTARLAAFLVFFQIVVLSGVVLAGRHFGGHGEHLVSLAMPPGGLTTIFAAVALQMSLAVIYGATVYAFDQQAFAHDIGPFAELMKSRTWWLLLIAAGIGAPLAEESLFRGYLYGKLRWTPIGRIGAAIVTSMFWALLHANYSAYGLIAVALMGFYFAFLREKTGSILTPVICHGAYNSLIVMLLAFSQGNSLVGR